MSNTIWRRERMAEEQRDFEADERALQELQAKCCHFACHVVECDFQGRPTRVVCDECGAESYPEHPE